MFSQNCLYLVAQSQTATNESLMFFLYDINDLNCTNEKRQRLRGRFHSFSNCPKFLQMLEVLRDDPRCSHFPPILTQSLSFPFLFPAIFWHAKTGRSHVVHDSRSQFHLHQKPKTSSHSRAISMGIPVSMHIFSSLQIRHYGGVAIRQLRVYRCRSRRTNRTHATGTADELFQLVGTKTEISRNSLAQNADCSLKNKIIVLFITTFGTLSLLT